MVPSVDRAARLLELFESGSESFGITDFSRALGISKSSAFGIVRTLASHGLLCREVHVPRYQLGPTLVRLGRLAQGERSLEAIAQPELATMALDLEATALLMRFEDHRPRILARAESHRPLGVGAGIGQRLPFGAGACAKAYLAELAGDSVIELLSNRGLTRFTPATITDPDSLLASFNQIRFRGFATDDGEYLVGVRAVASMLSHQDQHRYCICLVGHQASNEHWLRWGPRCRLAAQSLDRALGAGHGHVEEA